MKQCFEAFRNRMRDALAADGYTLRDEMETAAGYTVSFEKEDEAVRAEYTYDDKLFNLYRGDPKDVEDVTRLTRVQTYLFDESVGDGTRECCAVASEFLETLQSKTGSGIAPSAPRKKKKSDSDSDESTADFFVNRIPTVMPECREPLVRHKTHYGQLLPRWFCEEVVVTAMHSMINDGIKKPKCREFFTLLSTMYTKGDLDTKAIIMQVLMPELPEAYYEDVKAYVSEDFIKAWKAGKKYFGKEVKPEKVPAMLKAAQYQADTLRQTR